MLTKDDILDMAKFEFFLDEDEIVIEGDGKELRIAIEDCSVLELVLLRFAFSQLYQSAFPILASGVPKNVQ